jgi:gluconolactonase
MKWKEGEGLSLYMKPSGYTGVVEYSGEPGSNGLLIDALGRVVFCEHGDRRISRLERDGGKKTLVDSYMGKRLNSPNDGVFKSNGIYILQTRLTACQNLGLIRTGSWISAAYSVCRRTGS